MELSTAIKLRQSVRAYKPDQITEEELQTILSAAQNSPIAMARFEQIHLTVVQDPAVLAGLNEMALEKMPMKNVIPTRGAPTLIFVSHAEEAEAITMGANASCIMENMLLTAADLGLGSCFIFGLAQANKDDPRLPQLLKLPKGFRAVCAAAIGYPAEPISVREVGQRFPVDYLK